MSVRRSLAWALSGQVASFLASFVGSVLLARLLSPREMGVYAVANATVGVVSILSTMGISAYVIRDVELPPARLASGFTINALLSATISAILFLVSFDAARFLHEPGVAPMLRVLAIQPLIQAFEFRPAAMLQRDMRFKPVAVIGTATTLLVAVTQIALAAHGFSFMSIGYATIAGALFSAVANIVVGWRYVSLRLSFEDWRGVCGFGFRMLTIGGVAVLTQRVADIILGRMLGIAALGLYSRASNIASMMFANVYGSATRFMFAKMSQDYRETGSVANTFVGGLELIIGVMWPLLFGLAVLSRPAIALLYGAKWIGAAPVLTLLMLTLGIALCFGMNWELFVIHDEVKRQTRYEMIRSIFGTLAFTIGCLFSISAAAVGRMVEATFGLALYLPHMSRLAETTNGRLFALYARGAGLTVAAVLPSLALMIWSGWDAEVSRPLLFASVGLGILLWLGAIYLLRHPLLDELLRLLRRPALAPAPAPM